MLRLLLAATLLAATPSMASTWPDEDWAYGAQKVATPEEMAVFNASPKCALTNTEGEEVRSANPPEYMVFRVAKDGTVYRLFNADAERYDMDFCA